jgi:hypothetical protein
MSLQVQEQKRRRRNKGKFMVRTQWKSKWKKELVEDYGTFSQMLKKHGTDTFQYWCAQCPPEKVGGCWLGYRLDGKDNIEFVKMSNTQWSLSRYGRHKAWIHPTLKIDGKRVILVANAFDVGGFGTVASASVGINTVGRLNREAARKARARKRKARAKKSWRTNRRTKRKYRR